MTNFDIAYDRNFLRHQLMPLIKQRWPGVDTTLTRVTEHSAAAAGLLDDLAELDFQKAYDQVKQTLSLTQLKKHSKNPCGFCVSFS